MTDYFAVISVKYKTGIFEILVTITLGLGLNIITRYMTPFFYLPFVLYPLVYFIFALKSLQKLLLRGLPHFVSCCDLQNTKLQAKDKIFKPVYIAILFLQKSC